MRNIQLACVPITPLALRENATAIAAHHVLIAEVDRVPVGFVLASLSEKHPPLFAQVVAVVQEAQRRGIGLQLLSAVAQIEPQRDLALATQETNFVARAMNEKFADVIGASIHRVKLGVYPDKLLGIPRGQGYRAWEIKRR